MIGISTLAYSNKDLATALSEIEKSAAHAEIFTEGTHDIIHTKNGGILPSFSLSYSLHAPTMDINLASPREKVRKTGVEIMKDSAIFCMNNNIDIMVVHPGYTANKEMLAPASKIFEKSLADLQKIKEETGVRICIENMPNAEVFLFKTPDEID
ncbi:sugar phosphate isomerase/epimerase, partial [Methanimicrococcus sp. OttesenSCG-928-J09]|nr:sugar phosphate isomerase/epimerase [Methanimicrococcus sp. OttesenSCG-928-J09]